MFFHKGCRYCIKPRSFLGNVSEHVTCLFLWFVINRTNRLILMTQPGGSGVEETAHKNNWKENNTHTHTKQKLLQGSLYLWAYNDQQEHKSVDAHFNCSPSGIKSHKSVVPHCCIRAAVAGGLHVTKAAYYKSYHPQRGAHKQALRLLWEWGSLLKMPAYTSWGHLFPNMKTPQCLTCWSHLMSLSDKSY